MQDDQLDYHLDDIDENLKNTKSSKKNNTMRILLIFGLIIIILLIAALITFIVLYLKKDKNENDFILEKYINISYAINHTITNTFTNPDMNYEENIKKINNGEDYYENDRNVYDLYIPEYAFKNKDKYNGIILWIHGGAWIQGNKEDNNFIIEYLQKEKFIQANMGYTLVNTTNDEQSNIYRIIDEIKACISHIKFKLKSLGFSDKLGIALGGGSAGAHLSLLYSYLIDDSEIPIKFVINMVGPVGLDPIYYCVLKDQKDEPLDIDDFQNTLEIQKALNNSKIIPGKNPKFSISLMNYFIGNNHSDEFIDSIIVEGKIDINNPNYTTLLDEVKNADVTKIKDKNKCPTICLYSGRDDIAGLGHFANLKIKAKEDKRKLDFIYSKYTPHNAFEIDQTSNITINDGELARKLSFFYISFYAETYFKE